MAHGCGQTHRVAKGESVYEVKVLVTVDVPVTHEQEVLLIHTALDVSRHGVREHVSSVPLLHQCLGGRGPQYSVKCHQCSVVSSAQYHEGVSKLKYPITWS